MSLRRVRRGGAPAHSEEQTVDLVGTRRTSVSAALLCVVATGASAFLLFQIQPILSKALLPVFGGSASVWSASLVFFQTMLLAGYALAHAAARSPRWGLGTLAFVALAGVLSLPVSPATHEAAASNGAAAVLNILSRTVALPFLLLATAAPTLQRWYGAAGRDAETYRLYAVSNAGALVALLSYPFFWEVRFDVPTQLRVWSVAFASFAVLYIILGLHLGRAAAAAHAPPLGARATAARRSAVAWLALPALSSALLMAVTEHVCRELTVVPFLWVVPLALYLLSFAMTFSGDDVYPRLLVAVTVCLVLALLAFAPELQGLLVRKLGIRVPLVPYLQTVEARSTLYLAFFFAAAFFCHGELYRRRPHHSDLTRFYLAVSAGGALGGMLVALICPAVFSDYVELPLLSLATFVLASAVIAAHALRLRFPLLRFAGALAAAGAAIVVGRAELRPLLASQDSLSVRTFHGVLRVVSGEDLSGTPYVALYHGGVLHGVQYTDAELRREPTTYYSRDSGAGVAIETLGRSGPLHAGVIGLGAGTLAAYQRPGDVYRFYELDAAVAELARTHFDFLASAPGEIHVEIGDGRLLLADAPPIGFDILLIDAFSGDSVPAHLLTREAFDVYLRHVAEDGIIGVHVSNRYLRLARVVLGSARELGLAAALITTQEGTGVGDAGSDWVLLSRRADVLRSLPEVAPMGADVQSVLWTDQRSDLYAVLH